MNYFINRVGGRLTVNTWRAPGTVGTDLEDMLHAIETDNDEDLCISAEGVKDALCDGECLAKMNADQDAVETLYAVLCESQHTSRDV